jgi:pilus assembly protein Flp/PilA
LPDLPDRSVVEPISNALFDWEPRMTLLWRFLEDETGATAIEYGLIAAGIALAIITTVNNVGTVLLNNKFNSISSALK